MPLSYEQAKARERYKIKRKLFGHVGSGAESNVYAADLIFKNKRKRKNVVVKEMNDKLGVFFSPHLNALGYRQRIINAKKVYTFLKRKGVAVPSFFVPRIRMYSGRESIIMEDLRINHGKLYPINPKKSPDPLFLKKLSVKKDYILIKEIARDFATILNGGFIPHALDFWMFYKKENSYGRVISDLTLFTHKNDEIYSATPRSYFTEQKQELLNEFYHFLGKEEFKLFLKEYESHITTEK